MKKNKTFNMLDLPSFTLISEVIKKSLVFIFISFLIPDKFALAISDPYIVTGYFITTKQTSIREILQSDLNIQKKYLERAVILNTKLNQIRTMESKINIGTKVYIEVPWGSIDPDLFKGKMVENNIEELKIIHKIVEEKKIEPQPPIKTNNLKITIGSNFSLGNLESKKIGNSYNLKTSQNSPISLSVLINDTIMNNLSLSYSLYSSFFTPAKINNIEKNLPLEFGSNIYIGLNSKDKISAYSGLDYESLNLFKENYYNNFSNYKLNLYYITLGTKFSFSKFISKLSFSKIITSSKSENKKTTGHKFILYNTIPFYENYAATLFIKLHDITNHSETQIIRFGAGISYTF